MDVKAAVRTAKEYVADLLADEGIINLGLEEVVFDEGDGTWNVTVGFSRPWELARNPMTAITGSRTKSIGTTTVCPVRPVLSAILLSASRTSIELPTAFMFGPVWRNDTISQFPGSDVRQR